MTSLVFIVTLKYFQRAGDGNATELEDFYFDDDLHSSSLYKEKYMRLQSTMAMDTNSMSTPHALSSFTSPIISAQRSATAVASSSSERERMAGIQIAGKSIPGILFLLVASTNKGCKSVNFLISCLKSNTTTVRLSYTALCLYSDVVYGNLRKFMDLLAVIQNDCLCLSDVLLC